MDTSRKAKVYVRVSDDRQIDNYSVRDQRDLEKLACKMGFTDVDVVEEQAVSGESLANRPGMQAILAEVADGAVGAIFVTSFHRLSRDQDGIDGRLIKQACRINNTVIVTPEKVYDFRNDLDDDLADLLFFFAKIQKRMNVRSMINGMYRKAKEGGFVGRTPSFGYRLTWREIETPRGREMRSDLEVVPEEARVAKWIHEVFPKMTYRQIVRELNENAVKGEGMYFPIKLKKVAERYDKPERLWQENDIKYIIRNRLLTGKIELFTKGKSQFTEGFDPVTQIRPDLQIIDEATFERNQRIAKERKRIAPRSKTSPYLFSGILKCPYCSGSMVGRVNQPTYRLYACERHNHSGTTLCQGYRVNEAVVKAAVLPVIRDLIQKNLKEHLVAHGLRATQKERDQESHLKALLGMIDKELENLMYFARQGAITPTQLREENFKLLAKRREIEEELAAVSVNSQVVSELQNVLTAFDTSFDDVLERMMDEPVRFRGFLRLFFDNLTVVGTSGGKGWAKGLKAGQKRPPIEARITRFRFHPAFELFVLGEEIPLPEGLAEAEWIKVTDSGARGFRSTRSD